MEKLIVIPSQLDIEHKNEKKNWVLKIFKILKNPPFKMSKDRRDRNLLLAFVFNNVVRDRIVLPNVTIPLF